MQLYFRHLNSSFYDVIKFFETYCFYNLFSSKSTFFRFLNHAYITLDYYFVPVKYRVTFILIARRLWSSRTHPKHTFLMHSEYQSSVVYKMYYDNESHRTTTAIT